MSETGENEQRSGFWGTTLSKLKSALSRTKSAVVDSIVDREPAEQSAEVPETPTATVTAQLQSGQTSTTSERRPDTSARARETTTVAPHTVPPARPVREIDDDYLQELEEKLIKADLGLATAETMVNDLRKEARAKGWTSRDVEAWLKSEFRKSLAVTSDWHLRFDPGQLNIYLVVGVNGTGKTTSIGKLCWRFRTEGKKVLMAAGDTFRAAAETQLEIWSERAGVDIVRLPEGSDPGAVVYQAIQRAKNESYDALVIDTAGRLHNKANLMAELKKVRGVIEKNSGQAMLEALLVLDASTGQNGLQQARLFTEVCPLTGVILTKLDGTAKGGVVFSIARDLKIPVKLVGLGEQIDDLRDFDPQMFVEALF